MLSVPRLCWLAEWDGPELPGTAEEDVPDGGVGVEHSEVGTAIAVIVAGDGDGAGPTEVGCPELPGAAEQDVPRGRLRVEHSEVGTAVAVIVAGDRDGARPAEVGVRAARCC